MISGSMQLHLTIYDQTEGHLRMRQSHTLHQFTDIGTLGHGRL